MPCGCAEMMSLNLIGFSIYGGWQQQSCNEGKKYNDNIVVQLAVALALVSENTFESP